MKAENQEVTIDYFPFFRVYKNGHVQKLLWPPKKIPPYDDPVTGVKSKDVIISTNPDISARIFLPRLPSPTRKLSILVYIHGGGFATDSAFSLMYHCHVSSLSSKASVLAVSVEYRLAPENLIPACYEDCWTAFRWIAAHADGSGSDPWLNNHGDFSHAFIGGDSVGANISHNIAVRAGEAQLPGIILSGLVLVHPMFFIYPDLSRSMLEYYKAWVFMCPSSSGPNDTRLNPSTQDMAKIMCERVLICVAKKDFFYDNGRRYYKDLQTSGWKGMSELVETEGERHCFHLLNQNSEKALDLVGKIVNFIKQGCSISSL